MKTHEDILENLRTNAVEFSARIAALEKERQEYLSWRAISSMKMAALQNAVRKANEIIRDEYALEFPSGRVENWLANPVVAEALARGKEVTSETT